MKIKANNKGKWRIVANQLNKRRRYKTQFGPITN